MARAEHEVHGDRMRVLDDQQDQIDEHRERVFDAVIDKVEVKTLGELSPREIEHDNPEIRRSDDFATFLGQLYNRDVSEEDTVTVIRFSPIR